MSMLKKFNNMFSSEEDEIFEEERVSRPETKDEQNYSQRETKVTNSQKKVNLTDIKSKKGDVILLEPLVFADSKDIIDDIKANKVVILNLNKLDLQTSDRLLDFISGGIYAIDAKLKTIGDEIYLCVPKGVEVAGEFSEGEY
ncbi:cell division protein SepF [Gemelliphila palaticanis]|uniref:Cell division protein SepF n=1 Tax=Gemelliphila palaticanis TaxID=81950 RepID=A0ABX2T2U1_9BACL|nr:cell division protein SepF [Gemella palaticanis]MBF0715859.1 cell division protein SepF [Gemella palaticanis]NYS47789.1 cell division protein SepF [Gemella palaticanis]